MSVAADYTPGRSLLAELTTLREEMETLRKAVLLMVDLQRDIHTKIGGVTTQPTIDSTNQSGGN
jgi:hypothetical protein